MKRVNRYLHMKEHYFPVPYLDQMRRVRVLLPKDYEISQASYPVVYFQDGQNVFHSREAFAGLSWKIIPTIKRNPDLAKMIIVAIDNGEEERMNEYSAWKYSAGSLAKDDFGGKGMDYAMFVMEEIKPFIDSHYRTLPQAETTAMIGSSLGANISQFMGLQYGHAIGRLGIFSSANFLTQESFDRFLAKKGPNLQQRIYIQVGTQEGDDTDRSLVGGNLKQLYIDTSFKYYQDLLRFGMSQDQVTLQIVADGIHHEKVWAQYLLPCLRFLSEDWPVG